MLTLVITVAILLDLKKTFRKTALVASIILLQHVINFFPNKSQSPNIYSFIENVLSNYDNFQKNKNKAKTQKSWKVKRFHNFF